MYMCNNILRSTWQESVVVSIKVPARDFTLIPCSSTYLWEKTSLILYVDDLPHTGIDQLPQGSKDILHKRISSQI